MSILVLVIVVRIQIYLKPYIHEENNELEIWSLLAGIATMYCGILFNKDSEDSLLGLKIFAILVLTLINLSFLIRWIFHFLLSFNFKNKYVQAFIRVLKYLGKYQEVLLIEPKGNKIINLYYQ